MKFCTNCGKKIEEEKKFCSNCGQLNISTENNNSNNQTQNNTNMQQNKKNSGCGKVALIVVISFVVFFIGTFLLAKYIFNTIDNPDYETETLQVGDLKISVPENSIKKSELSTETNNIYTIVDNKGTTCNLKINIEPANIDVKSYLEQKVVYNTDDEYKGINKVASDESWNMASVTTKDSIERVYYATTHNDQIYYIELEYDLSDLYCLSVNRTIVKTLEFEK